MHDEVMRRQTDGGRRHGEQREASAADAARVLFADQKIDRIGQGRADHQQGAKQIGTQLFEVQTTHGEENTEVGEGGGGEHATGWPLPIAYRGEEHDHRRIAEDQHTLDAGIDHGECREVEQRADVIAERACECSHEDCLWRRRADGLPGFATQREPPEEWQRNHQQHHC